MFGKLKNKLKEWTEKVSEVEEEQEEVVEEGQEGIIEEKKETKEEPKEEKKGFFKKLFSKKEEIEEESEEEIEKEKPKEKKESKKTPKKESEKKEKEEPKKKEEKLKKEIKEETIDEELKEEVEKEKYIEPETKYDIALQKLEPEIEKVKEQIEEKEEMSEEEKPALKSVPSEEGKKKSFFKKLISSKKTISNEEFDEYSEDLEMILLENNVALEVAEKIISELKAKITNQELEKKEIENLIKKSLKEIIEDVLLPPFDIIEEIKNKEGPYIMIFCGINGVGKTTQIAKVASMLKEKGITSVMAAGDTFRAAAVEQLKKHGEKLDIKVVAHDYGSDPAAVGFDAIKYAEKNKVDTVLIDTAGRIHTATNLLREMEKIKRVCKPDRTIFVGESITGNDSVDQVRAFDETIGIDGIFLSKADIDEKGGTALSVGFVTKKPIIFLGTGQNYKDLEPFDKEKFIEKLELD